MAGPDDSAVVVTGAILVLALLASIVAFVLMGVDKRAAERGRRRIPERTLHLCELLGGWPGSLLAQRLFRHKTVKLGYRIAFWSAVCLHLAIAAVAIAYAG